MPNNIEMVMPKMGESIMEVRLLVWHKQVGQRIEKDETIAEVATDKVDTELPSLVSGIIKKLIVQEGEMAQVGKPMCLIEVDGSDEFDKNLLSEIDSDFESIDSSNIDFKVFEPIIEISNDSKTTSLSTKFYSPLVLSIAKLHQISRTELDRVSGTGLEGRVTKNDILNYTTSRKSVLTTPINEKEEVFSVPLSAESDEIVEMDRMRIMIAERMIASKNVSAHVTSFIETDMTVLAKWREINKIKFQDTHQENLTFTPLLIEAVVKAIQDFPLINIQVAGNTIIKKHEINIGMAVALPNGNLIVPVIHNANRFDLVGLTKKVNDLSKRAKEGKLKPQDLEGGTYTISNIGTFGNLMGTPIIVQPQVAIMAFGAIQKRPSVIETPNGDFVGIRQKMFISHSYDHRVVDGQLGGLFLKKVSDYLENFDNTKKF